MTAKDSGGHSIGISLVHPEMVGARGFEPPASWSRTRRATRLRYAPKNHPYKNGRGERIRTPGLLVPNQLLRFINQSLFRKQAQNATHEYQRVVTNFGNAAFPKAPPRWLIRLKQRVGLCPHLSLEYMGVVTRDDAGFWENETESVDVFRCRQCGKQIEQWRDVP
jgi:hypothetical protein